MEKYNLLKKHKKAYVICAVGQAYIDSTQYVIEVLNRYTKYPIFLYYANGDVNYDFDKLIIQPFTPANVEMDSNKSLKFLTTLKAHVTLSVLKNYDVDTIIMLDSDIVVTPVIDDVFDEYENEIENYPIFLRYSWTIINIMGRQHVSDYIREYVGAKHQNLTAICSCLCIANRNCLSFLEEWKQYCEDKHLIDYHYNQNPDIYFDFNDEAIANALLWKYKATKVMECNLVWGVEEKTATFAFEYYDGRIGKLERHSSYPSHFKVPEEYEVPFGLSVLPERKRDMWGFHGPKDIEEIKKIANIIETRF